MQKLWSGRVDGWSELDLRFHQVLREFDDGADFGADLGAKVSAKVKNPPSPKGSKQACFLGYDSDDGIARNQGRVGAAQGPGAIRAALGSLAAIEGLKLYDAGDVGQKSLEAAHEGYVSKMQRVLGRGMLGIGLGGGHDIAWASFCALRATRPGARIGVINIDAHLDLRDYETGPNSGTAFAQILASDKNASYAVLGYKEQANTKRLREKARQHGVLLLHWDMDEGEALARLQDFVAAHECIYLSIDMDAFSSAHSPGVSAPQPLGLEPRLAVRALRMIVASKKLALMDLAELSPRFDIDARSAKLAAALIYEALSAYLKG